MSNPVKEDIDDASSSKSNSLESTQSEINKINSMDIERNHVIFLVVLFSPPFCFIHFEHKQVLSEESSLENDLHSDYDVQPETVSKESTDDDENKSKKSLSQSNTHVESIDDTTESDKNKNDNDQEQNRDLESGSSDDSWVFARRP